MSESSRAPHLSAVLPRAGAIWLPIAAAATGLAVLMYAGLQQDLRLGADDPQVALARATADRLDAGSLPGALVATDRTDLSRTLDPFVLVFDTSGRLLASSVTLRGQPPDYPAGVFDAAHARGETRVTWQPEPGIRSATVAVPWHGGYVVAGRSLLLTEQHIDQIGTLIAAGWLGTLGLIGLAAVLASLRT